MSSKFLRVKMITGTAVAAVLCAQTFYLEAKSQSDWVDDGVTEFNLPRGETPSAPPISPEDEASPFQRTQPPSMRQNPSSGRSSQRDDGSFTQRDKGSSQNDDGASQSDEGPPPIDAPVKNVTDSGGIELGEDGKPRRTRVPLEAGISTYRQKDQTNGDGTGIDQRAERLMSQSPMLAAPRTISADPKQFKAWLTETHPGLLENVTREQIIEVDGEWDDASHVLRTFGLPHTRVSAKKLGEVNLTKTKIIVVNCEGHLSQESLANIRRFVAMGGSLLTTDWALENVVERAFPGIVGWYKGYYTDEQSHLVDAVVVGEDQALLAGVPPIGHWQLVKKSQIVRLIQPAKVEVLARSRGMTREDPSGLGILAFAFGFGQGRVMHLVGHFDNNSELAFNTALPDPAPGLKISLRQAIAANFIAEALKQGEVQAKQE